MKTSISTLVAERFAFAEKFENDIAAIPDDAAHGDNVDAAVENGDCVLGMMDRLISELPPATLADLRAQLVLYRDLTDWDDDGPAEPLFQSMLAGLDRLAN